MSRRIIVCGASGLLGSAIVTHLAIGGCYILPTYRTRKKPVDKLCQTFSNIFQPVHYEAEDTAALLLAAERFQPDALIDCTGHNMPAALEFTGKSDWEKILDTNLTGPALLVRDLAPILADGGSIVLLGSVSADLGGPLTPHYAAAKAGLVALARNAALWLAPRGIRVNICAPGYIESPMAEASILKSPTVAATIAKIPMGQLGKPEDVVGCVDWLVSDASRYVTGQVIRVNGGLTW